MPHGKRQGSICHDEKVAYRPFLLSGILDIPPTCQNIQVGRISWDAMKPAEAEASWHRSRDRLSACPANRGDPEWSWCPETHGEDGGWEASSPPSGLACGYQKCNCSRVYRWLQRLPLQCTTIISIFLISRPPHYRVQDDTPSAPSRAVNTVTTNLMTSFSVCLFFSVIR